jgi:hypothetical protein
MHVTTHETSQKIKDAGFQQPAFSVGQIWYTENGGTYLISGINSSDGIPYGKRLNADNWSIPLALFNTEGWSYAASATELLPEKHSLIKLTGGAWKCTRWDKKYQYPEYTDENPAEAAAKSYFFTKNH